MSRRLAAFVLSGIFLLVLLGIGAMASVLFLGTQDQHTTHAFASPSGQVNLYLVESCLPDSCTHQALLETPAQGEDQTDQIRCGLDIEATKPVFVTVDVTWTEPETGVIVTFAGADGDDHRVIIDFERDCSA